VGSTDVSLLGTEAPYAELVAKEAGGGRGLGEVILLWCEEGVTSVLCIEVM